MKFRHFTTLRTDFDAEECLRRLRESVDREQPATFSLSGYKGSKPMIGRILGYEFYLHRRRYWRNDFAPAFYGNCLPQDRGTIVEGYFDLQPWVKMFMRFWQGGLVVLGGLVFVLSLLKLLTGASWVEGNPLIGLLAAPIMLAFGIWLPKYGLWWGRNDEPSILEFLQSTLVARIEQGEQNSQGAFVARKSRRNPISLHS